MTTEERFSALEQEIERLHAINDIQRLMGNYMTNHVRHGNPTMIGLANSYLFFADREDSTVEIADYGVYVGYGNIKKMYANMLSIGPCEGVMYEHNLATPQIVVAGDGKTARGLWQSPGHETDARFREGVVGEDPKPFATWVWGRVNADFIKVDGKWKIWHYHWYRLFRCPFDESWADYIPPSQNSGGPANNPAFAGMDLPVPSRPTTYHNVYSNTTGLLPIPPCPEPYETWTDDRPPV
jgi:hypothetical protein